MNEPARPHGAMLLFHFGVCAAAGSVLEVVQAAHQRLADAKSVQRMMVSVLKARLMAENAHEDSPSADRGSEMGDCMELLDDDFDDGGDTLSGEQ